MKNVLVKREFIDGLIDWVRNVEEPFIDDNGNEVNLCDHKGWRYGIVEDDKAIDANEDIELKVSCPVCNSTCDMVIGPNDTEFRKDLSDNLCRTKAAIGRMESSAPTREEMIFYGFSGREIEFVEGYMVASIPVCWAPEVVVLNGESIFVCRTAAEAIDIIRPGSWLKAGI